MTGRAWVLANAAIAASAIASSAAAQAPAASAPPAQVEPAGDAPQPVPTLPAVVDGAKTYAPADFARFAPRTALDMLRQVPGFPLPAEAFGPAVERRGLGQATINVLINGQRLSGKSNDVVAELGRIAAENVVRIEIVDGATLDVPGLTGQVANIVTNSRRALSGSFAWRPQFRARITKPRLLDADAAINGRIGGMDYTLALENRSTRNGNGGPEVVRLRDGTISDLRDEVLTIVTEQPRVTGTLRRIADNGAIANLNASVQLFHNTLEETSLRSGPGQVDRDRRLRETEREWNYEVGGDYEFGVGGGRLKLVGLRRFEHSPFGQLLTVDYADGRSRTGDRFAQVADEGETIARGEYRWKAGAADWQLSIEGALNRLDVDNQLFSLDAGGVFRPVVLANGTGRVDEARGEAIVSYGRPLSPTLGIQASVGGEVSQIRQTGAGGITRSFVRPKGSVALAWKPSPRLDVSAKLERVVGQLNFFDFVASANISAGTGNAGNVNLVPQQSWDFEAQAVRNLGPWGTVTLRGFGRSITDIVDVIPIGTDGQSPGNLDGATVYGGQAKATINLDPAGLKGARVTLDVQLQNSALADPVTAERRPINEMLLERIVLGFRYDVPGTDWAYGADFDRFRLAASYRLDLRQFFYNRPGNFALFLEHKDVMGLTVRGQVDNLFDQTEGLIRDFYDRRRTAALLFSEKRDRHAGPIFTLAITGKI